MPTPLASSRHLIRMAALFAAGVVVFLILRTLLVPKDFGRLGHYRAGALEDNKALPLVHAGKAACLECHGDVARTMAAKQSGHRTIGCESCHGPQAAHATAEDPGRLKPKLPEARPLCLGCHSEDSARPAFLPQQDPKRHNPKSACADCHSPHAPRMEDSK